MNDSHIIKICLAFVIIGVILYFAFYEEEFKETSISDLLEKEGNKGIVLGRIEYIIKFEPGLFVLAGDEKVNVFYPKKIEVNVDDTVIIFAETRKYNDKLELFAYKVIKK